MGLSIKDHAVRTGADVSVGLRPPMTAAGTRRVREWMGASLDRICDFPDPPGSGDIGPRSYGLISGRRRKAVLTVAALSPALQGPLIRAAAVWAAATAATAGGTPLLSIIVGSTPGSDIDVRLGPLRAGVLGSASPDGASITLNSAVAWVPAAPAGFGQQSMLAVLVHELGHALGLLHSTNRNAAMWPFGGREALSQEDRAAIRALYGWSEQQPIRDVGTDSAPAICALPGALVLAWKGIDETQLWVSRTEDGENWTPQHGVFRGASTDGPTLAWDGTTLWMAWTGIAGDTSLYWSVSTDGSEWSIPEPIEGVGSAEAPSLTVFRGTPFLVWRGIPDDDGLYYTAWDDGGWLPQERIGGTGSSDRPAVCVDVHGVPRMVWRGVPGDDDLYTSSMETALDNPKQGFWEPQQKVQWIIAGNGSIGTAGVGQAASALGPVLTADASRVFMAWRGVDGDSGLYFTQGAAGLNSIPRWEWSTQAVIEGVGSSQTPALALFQDRVHLVWKGAGDDHTIWHAFVGS